VAGRNADTVGIELVNRGRWPDWLHTDAQSLGEAYPEAQIEALIGLLRALQLDLPGLRWIAGHEDLDRRLVPATDDAGTQVRRKRDPGPGFPWARVTEAVTLERVFQ
jgi:N-acetylmuramoyl-L-alanine amidase